MAEAQSGGTRTSGACSGAGEPGLLGLGVGLGSGHGAWVAGDAGGGNESGCCFIDRRRFRIAASLDAEGTVGRGGEVLRRGGEEADGGGGGGGEWRACETA